MEADQDMSAAVHLASQGQQQRKVTFEQIAAVQNMIEKCMQLYMEKGEVMACLKTQANIEPNFTQLVWQKLEEQNADFFRAYHLHVKVKDQMVLFNQLLEQQVQLLQEFHGGVQQAAPLPLQRPAGQAAAGGPLPHQGVVMGPAAALPNSTAGGPTPSQQRQQQQQPPAPSSMPLVTTQQQQEQFQQQFNQHLQQHVQQHLQQHLQQQQLAPSSWPMPFGTQPAAMAGLGALPSLPYPFLANPAALAAAAAAAAAAAGGTAAGAVVRPAATTASTSTVGTGGTTPMAVRATNPKEGFAGSTTDMLAAWGLGGSAAEAAAATRSAAGDGAAAMPASSTGATQQQQQQQQQHNQMPAQTAAQQLQAAAATQSLGGTGRFAGAANDGDTAAVQQPAADVAAGATAGMAVGRGVPCMLPVSSSGYLPIVSSCAMLDAEQLPPLTKAFSLSDLNALDIPGQLTGELGDFAGLGEAEAATDGAGGGPTSAGQQQAMLLAQWQGWA